MASDSNAGYVSRSDLGRSVMSSGGGHSAYSLAMRNMKRKEMDGSSTGRYTSTHGYSTKLPTDTTNSLHVNDEVSSSGFNMIEPECVLECQSESDPDEPGRVILSMFRGGGKFGAASYDPDSAEVQLLADTEDIPPDYPLARKLINQTQPSHVIVSARQGNDFIEMLNTICSLDTNSNDGDSEMENNDAELAKPHLHLQPSLEFAYESCKRRVLLLKLPCEPVNVVYTEEKHLFLIGSYVDFQSTAMVRALGALLKFLDKEATRLDLLHHEKRVVVAEITSLNLADMLTMDEATYSSLQVFSHDWHPSVYKRGGFFSRSKEGLSLYGILNRCKSLAGARLMRAMIMQPTKDRTVLNARLDAVQYLMAPSNAEVTKICADCLKHMSNVSILIAKISKLQATAKDWRRFRKTIYNAVMISELCKEQPQTIPLFEKITKCQTPALIQVLKQLDKVINFEDSIIANKIVVKLGIDPELDRKKQQHNNLPNMLSFLIAEEIKKHPYIQNDNREPSMLFVPDLGYLLAVRILEGRPTENDKEILGLDFVFENAGTLYFKNDTCRALDSSIGDCYYQILEHENRIILKLACDIEANSAICITLVKHLAELDCLVSMAMVARENNFIRPSLTEDGSICIKGGRHPLQELCVDTFVPNDTLSGGDHGKVKILTGPNACGKSVYLKQVALIVFMAHIGSYVPAKVASITQTDCIHACIQSTESISGGVSAFMADVTQVSLQLRCSTKNSLLILDEFGVGTSDLDGLSLLAATLQELGSKGADSPHIFATTHFHRLPSLMGNNVPGIKMQTMEAMFTGQEVVFLYKLVEGTVKSSLAFRVAAGVGVDKQFLRRSNEVFQCLGSGKMISRSNNSGFDSRLQDCKELVRQFMELENPDDYERFFNEKVKPLIGMGGEESTVASST